MQTALEMEKNVNASLLDLNKLADSHGDVQVIHKFYNEICSMTIS